MQTKLPCLLTLLALCGCVTRSTALNQVHLGMTEPEVRHALGAPVSQAETPDGGKVLYYTLREDWAGATKAGYSVHLAAGKVTSYGRETGPFSATGPAVLPIVVH